MTHDNMSPSGSAAAASPFKPPLPPSLPQDLSLIAEMVGAHQVVGSLPPIGMSAADKRKLVEASLRSRTLEKGKGKEVGRGARAGVEGHEETSSDESSSEEEDDDVPVAAKSTDIREEVAQEKREPMTTDEYQTAKAQLTELIGPPTATAADDSDSDTSSSSEEESDEDSQMQDEGHGGAAQFEFSSSPVPSPRIRGGRLPPGEFIFDDEDEGTSGPITSIHEAPLPPVRVPPMHKLPEGEGLSLAGEVVSWMREKKVELWVQKQAEGSRLLQEADEQAVAGSKQGNKLGEGEEEEVDAALAGEGPAGTADTGAEDGELPDESDAAVPTPVKPSEAAAAAAAAPMTVSSVPAVAPAPPPAFTSAGTVVVRAMQSRPGAPDEGWLEEGSILCWSDGRVLGSVAETFGPLTSPFYSIRLPPPPYPYPAPGSLDMATRLYYPTNPTYRSFVNMHAVRDPRFKGSDASNLFDEEVGEEEMEWSDDEAEAEAKRRKKKGRGASRSASVARSDRSDRTDGGSGGALGPNGFGAGAAHGLPMRPHFDYQPADEYEGPAGSDAGSMYGGDGDGADEGRYAASEVGSTASGSGRGGRGQPVRYDDLADGADAGQRGPRRDGRGGDGRGRGRGRGGRGGGSYDRGGGRGRGGPHGQGRSMGPGRQDRHDQHGAGQHGRQSPYDRRPSQSPSRQPPLGLPPRPDMGGYTSVGPHGHAPYQPQQQYHPAHLQGQSFGMPPAPHDYQLGPQAYGASAQYVQPPAAYQHHGPPQGYSPSQPIYGAPPPTPQAFAHQGYTAYGNGSPSSYQQGPPPAPPGAAPGQAPAINPRFAAQYQAMMGQGSYGYPSQQP